MVAFITRMFELEPSEKKHLHSESECGWRIAYRSGEVVFQLDTYGSPTRQDVGTISQSLQLDEAMALEVVDALARTFPAVANLLQERRAAQGDR